MCSTSLALLVWNGSSVMMMTGLAGPPRLLPLRPLPPGTVESSSMKALPRIVIGPRPVR